MVAQLLRRNTPDELDAVVISHMHTDHCLDLVTLHVYSPPLLVMGQYSLTDPMVGEFADPIFDFALGGGI